MKRHLFGLTASVLLLYSQECIFHAAQKKIYKNEDTLFFQRFPKGHIIQDKGLYHFISGPYTKDELHAVLVRAKRYNRDAYSGPCRYIEIDTQNVVSKEHENRNALQQQQEEMVEAQEPIRIIDAQDYSIETTEEIVPPQEYANSNAIQQEKERSSVGSSKKEDAIESLYENFTSSSDTYKLTFQEFMHLFFQKDYKARNLEYEKKLQEIEALIEQDPYNWNISLSATLNYGKFIDYDFAVNKELTANIGLNVDKRLFDSGMLTKNLIFKLKKRLAHLSYLSTKDKMALYALDIYAQGYLNQKLKDLYKKDYETQKAMVALIKERKKAGLASQVDVLDAKNDLMELKKTIMRQLYDYLYSDFLIRNILELRTKKLIELQEFGFATSNEDITKIYKEAFYNNSLLNVQRMQTKIAKAEVSKRQNSFLPIVDLYARVAYEYKKDFANEPVRSTNGLNYSAGINIKIPLYAPENRSIYTEKAKLAYLKQHNLTLQQIRDLTREVHKTYNEIKRLQTDLDIVDTQIHLMQEKMFLVKQRYVAGLSPYRDYSDALKNYLAYIRQKAILEVQILQNAALLATLQGNHIFYGEN